MRCESKYTHANKAKSYDIGRPNYPEEFFCYLYGEFGLKNNAAIADIGAGTGKITKKFLEKGSMVFAVEPDKDMIGFLKTNLGCYPNCTLIESAAEETKITSASIDLIFCGNSYMWFDRNCVVPEFQRIAKNTKSPNIIIARLGPEDSPHTNKLLEIINKFHKPIPVRTPNNTSPFLPNTFITKTFEYSVNQNFDEFLQGCLSASSAPNPTDNDFEKCCESLAELFKKYKKDGKLEERFKLFCMIGCTKTLL